ncbi:MAG: metallophosphoesterase family protein [Candidatus Helarchaeota archaeon]
MRQKTAIKISLLLILLIIIPFLSIFNFSSIKGPPVANIPKLVSPSFSNSDQEVGSCGAGNFPEQTDNNSHIFWFVQISDTHLGNSQLLDPPSTWGWSYIFFESFFNELEYITPEFVVNTGDLVDGMPLIPFYQDIRQWELYESIVDKWGMNASYYYDLIGNHDVYGDTIFHYYKTYSVQGKAHGNTQFTWNVTKNYGNYTFIALNSADEGYIWPGSTFGDLNDTELNWFEQQLIQNQGSNLTFVFSHHPYNEISLDRGRKQKFTNLINNYNVTAHIYGHKHSNEHSTHNDTLYLCTASLGTSIPPSYRIVVIDNDGVSTATKRLGDWPLVIISSPLNEKITTRTYDLNQSTVPVRAVIFNNTNFNKVEFQIYNTSYEDLFPNFFINWESSWYQMSQSSPIENVWNGTLNRTNISDGFYYLRVSVDSKVKATIRIYLGNNNKPRIINGPIQHETKLKNSLPWKIDLSNYEYDRYDNSSQLTWTVSGFPYPCVWYINTESDDLFIIPIEGATGLSVLKLTLINSRGESVSQTILILIIDAVSEDEIFLGLWLATVVIISVTIITIYFRLKWLIKNKRQKIIEKEKKLGKKS